MIVFKECLPCGNKWSGRDEFLEDARIEIFGYQIDFDDLLAGIFLFNRYKVPQVSRICKKRATS